MDQYLQEWRWKVLTDCMWLYLVNFDFCPCVVCCIKVCRDMTVSVYVNGVREHDSRFTWALGTDCSLKRWSQLENLFSHYNCAQPRTGMQGDLTIVESVSVASNILTSALQKVNVDHCDDDDDGDKDRVCSSDTNCNVSAIGFCVEQLQLACSSPYSRRYSNNMLQFAFTLCVRQHATAYCLALVLSSCRSSAIYSGCRLFCRFHQGCSLSNTSRCVICV